MFLDRLLKTNRPLAELALAWQQDGVILPDTYVLDLDTITENAEAMKTEADRYKIKLYFMLKQLGRNPIIGQRLAELGLAGAVCVDFREALVLLEASVPLGNVGHLVQVPNAAMERIIAARPQIMTVYSVEKALQIGRVAHAQGFEQPIMLRIIGPHDKLYSGQYGGFLLDELDQVVKIFEKTPGVRIAGICSFPCLLFSETSGEVEPTPNARTVQQAVERMAMHGYYNLQINMPSVSCIHTVPIIEGLGGTYMEPGHGLTGTTPWHALAASDVGSERVGYVYVSEVSHNLGEHAFCYGGGNYRRGHLTNALVGASLDQAHFVGVKPPNDKSIDYYFELAEPAHINDGVLMCFRTQLFVTRSEVALVKGLTSGTPRLEGIFDTQGHRLR